MKKVLLLFLVFSTNVFSQTVIPCEFTWQSAATNNGTKNFITPVQSQPYQGPCLAFAFSAAIETMYAIEKNINNPSLKLSEAYLDYEAWSAPNHIPTLNSSFKIAEKTSNSEINAFLSECDINAPGNNCIHNSVVSNIINYPAAQKAYRVFLDTNVEPPVEAVEAAGALGSYVTVNNALELTTNDFSNDDDLKEIILEDGPIVLKVNGANNQTFRNYDVVPNLTYHAFIIIGWTDDNRWIIKDSWPGMAAIANTKQNTNIHQMMQQNKVQLYQVSGIGYNGGSASSNTISFTHGNCMPPEPPLTLSNISVDVDYTNIGGYNYGKFWVTSNVSVDTWVWGIAYPYGYRKRSQLNLPTYSSVLLSPNNSGYVTVYVRAYKDGITVTKERSIYLFNGQSGGGGNGGGGPE